MRVTRAARRRSREPQRDANDTAAGVGKSSESGGGGGRRKRARPAAAASAARAAQDTTVAADATDSSVRIEERKKTPVRPRAAVTYGRRGGRAAGRRASVALVEGRESLSPLRGQGRGKVVVEGARGDVPKKDEEGVRDDNEDDGEGDSEEEEEEGSEDDESEDGENRKEQKKRRDGLSAFWKAERAFWDDVDAVSLEEADDLAS